MALRAKRERRIRDGAAKRHAGNRTGDREDLLQSCFVYSGMEGTTDVDERPEDRK